MQYNAIQYKKSANNSAFTKLKTFSVLVGIIRKVIIQLMYVNGVDKIMGTLLNNKHKVELSQFLPELLNWIALVCTGVSKVVCECIISH